jgi:DNA-binding response OmpR family regulator
VRARETRSKHKTLAIALTAHAQAEDRLRVLTSGFQTHLSKPVAPAELLAVVASLTGRIGRQKESWRELVRLQAKTKKEQGMTSPPSRIILLLVEDSATCEALRPLLQADPFARYAVVEKETGVMGLEALRSVKTHAVLLAAELPDMKAQQWLTELNRANDLHKPPVIALLDKANPALEEELLQAGACFCLRTSELSPSVLQQALHCAIELAESKRTIAGQKLELLERRREFTLAQQAGQGWRVATEELPGETLPEMQQAAGRLRLAFEAGKMGYWEWRIKPNEMVWGGQTEKVFGLQPGEFKGTCEGFLELVHPEDQAWVAEDINVRSKGPRIIRPNSAPSGQMGRRAGLPRAGTPSLTKLGKPS